MKTLMPRAITCKNGAVILCERDADGFHVVVNQVTRGTYADGKSAAHAMVTYSDQENAKGGDKRPMVWVLP